MSMAARVAKLEQGRWGAAPAACLVYDGAAVTVHLGATGQTMTQEEYARRWPRGAALKCYTDARMVNPLVADWHDAPPPRSSADV